MQAIKAAYREGKIHLLSPMPEIKEAGLLIIVLDEDTQADGAAQLSPTGPSSPEEAFQAIGLTHFFATEDDANVDWEDMFDVKPR